MLTTTEWLIFIKEHFKGALICSLPILGLSQDNLKIRKAVNIKLSLLDLFLFPTSLSKYV